MAIGNEGDAGASKADTDTLGLSGGRSRPSRSTATEIMRVAARPLRPAPPIRRGQLLSLAIAKRCAVVTLVETRRTRPTTPFEDVAIARAARPCRR